MPNLLGLLLMLHLVGSLRPQFPHAQVPQAPNPQPQTGSFTPSSPAPFGAGVGNAIQGAQGAHGVGQGYHGSLAPILGGVGSIKNQGGLYPHQMNPFTFMAGLG